MRAVHKLLSFVGSALLLSVLPWASAQAQVRYNVTDIGAYNTLPYRLYARALNEAGDVTGGPTNFGFGYLFAAGDPPASGVSYDLLPNVRYRNTAGVTIGQGLLTGAGLNDRGVLVGQSLGYDRDFRPTGERRAAYFDINAGVTYDLGVPLGGQFAIANDVNDDGRIVGTTTRDASTGEVRAFLIINGTVFDIGAGSANAINGAGQVTGTARDLSSGVLARAYIYDNGTTTDLGTLGGVSSIGRDINHLGQVAGESRTGDGASHAFIYRNGVMVDLGIFAGGSTSEAEALNDFGDAVGAADRPTQGFRAALYRNGRVIDLSDLVDPALGLTLIDANDINNAGQIIADGRIDTVSGSYFSSFLLTPVGVPEPATWMLFIFGFGAVGTGLRRNTAASGSAALG